MNISLSPFAPGNLVSSRGSLLISILRLNLILTHGIPPISAVASISYVSSIIVLYRHVWRLATRLLTVLYLVPNEFTAESPSAQGQ